MKKAEGKLKHEFLKQHVFQGLNNLNNGFDVPSIYYFSEEDFEEVLKRVEALKLGIHGIEPWLDGDFFDVQVSDDPMNPSWYWGCFEVFKTMNIPLQYAASYEVPKSLLDTFEKKSI